MLCWILTGCFLKLKIFKIHSDMSLRWPLVINCVYKPFEATGPMIFKLKIFALYPWLFEVFHIFCLYFVKWVFFFFYLVSQYFLYYPLPMSTASFFFPSWVFSLSFSSALWDGFSNLSSTFLNCFLLVSILCFSLYKRVYLWHV